jgi:hypothetical protein
MAHTNTFAMGLPAEGGAVGWPSAFSPFSRTRILLLSSSTRLFTILPGRALCRGLSAFSGGGGAVSGNG